MQLSPSRGKKKIWNRTENFDSRDLNTEQKLIFQTNAYLWEKAFQILKNLFNE